MRWRDFILIGAAVMMGLLAGRAQAEPVRTIGVLMGMDATDPAGQAEVKAFQQGLQELGWIEGRNLHIAYSWAGSEPDRIRASAKELVASNCEVIVARTTPVVAALLEETRVTPIVFTYVFDPIGSGFVQNFARPAAM
jgi:putative tryptophan/tyrosine transport system substrate-binding protein